MPYSVGAAWLPFLVLFHRRWAGDSCWLIYTSPWSAYLFIFIYFQQQARQKTTANQNSLKVKCFPMAQVIHTAESQVLITSQGALPVSRRDFCPCPVWKGGVSFRAECRCTAVWDHCFHIRSPASLEGTWIGGTSSGPCWGGQRAANYGPVMVTISYM